MKQRTRVVFYARRKWPFLVPETRATSQSKSLQAPVKLGIRSSNSAPVDQIRHLQNSALVELGTEICTGLHLQSRYSMAEILPIRRKTLSNQSKHIQFTRSKYRSLRRVDLPSLRASWVDFSCKRSKSLVRNYM